MRTLVYHARQASMLVLFSVTGTSCSRVSVTVSYVRYISHYARLEWMMTDFVFAVVLQSIACVTRMSSAANLDVSVAACLTGTKQTGRSPSVECQVCFKIV